jgi:hypothetical protein
MCCTVTVYFQQLFTPHEYTRGCQVVGTTVQSVQTSERLRELRKSSLLLPLHNIIFFVNLFYFQVAMTYCVELFLCMVLGLAIGHAIFNSSSPVCRPAQSHLWAFFLA